METHESYLNNKLLECMTGDIIKFTSTPGTACTQVSCAVISSTF